MGDGDEWEFVSDDTYIGAIVDVAIYASATRQHAGAGDRLVDEFEVDSELRKTVQEGAKAFLLNSRVVASRDNRDEPWDVGKFSAEGSHSQEI